MVAFRSATNTTWHNVVLNGLALYNVQHAYSLPYHVMVRGSKYEQAICQHAFASKS